MRARLPLAAGAFAAAAAVAVAAPAAPAGAAAGERAAIAFSSTRAIWSVPLAGGEARRVTDGRTPTVPCRCPAGDLDGQPAWSPDGHRLAFTRGARIHVVDADGRNLRRIRGPAGSEDTRPAWSKDGRLAFLRARDAGGTHQTHEIVAVRPGTGAQHVVAGPSPFAYRAVSWAPDGRRLAYVVPYHDPAALFTVGLFVVPERGGTPRFLLRAVGMDDVDWSPDGRALVFTSSVPGAEPFDPFRLYTIRLADRRIVQVTDGSSSRTGDASPRWSPDGARIAFTRSGPRGSAVYLVRPDRGGERLLARDAAGPAWSPDGRLIAFLAGVSGARRPWTVSVMRPDGTAKRSLARVRRPAAGDWLGPQSWSRSAG